MPGIFRTPTTLVFLDEDNHELARVPDAALVPRVGENVRLREIPYLVDRVGYDIPTDAIERIFVICRPA